MTKRSNTFHKLILVISLLLIISIIECIQLGIGFEEGQSNSLACKSICDAEDGNTCLGIVKKFNLNVDFFSAINPNLNCNTIFVGQWLCIDGTMN
ncbi:hypothetical protein CFP56_011882 [Quercus suber]|uniref:LysM domain-containing protein n=1 Tax=Quercus suber TaxID=58331 RepID=A0AAW0KX45_QUESU